MSVVKDGYRGTTKYFHVMAELVRAAQYRGLTTYQDIAVIMGLPLRGSHIGAETGHVLGEISEDEATAGRPMLSSVAVGVRGKLGPGFSVWPETLAECAALRMRAHFARENVRPPTKHGSGLSQRNEGTLGRRRALYT